MEKLRQQIEQRLSAVMGDACFYYENLATGVCFGHAADKPVVAGAGVYASHGYERSHIEGLANTFDLLNSYIETAD